MNRPILRAAALLLVLALASCGSDGSTASIETRLSSAKLASESIPKFRGGAASAASLESLKYQIFSIAICESLTVDGSGFQNPTNCVELYGRDGSKLTYDVKDDWTPLADKARASDSGFIDLLSESSRAQLARATLLTHEHAHAYNFGIITWALPIKVKATVTLADGSALYTHDGTTGWETIGVDNFRSYFTAPRTALNVPPAEEAVVLLGNGGNWFRFQSPFVITAADIDERRAFVLDLVFNPEGIVQGFEASFANGNLSERAGDGSHLRDITVPMLDLAPVPHRATEQVLRETYQGSLTLEDNSFDLRLELYYVEGDPSGTIYGVDLKTLVNAQTTGVPPVASKVSFLDRADDGTLTFSAHRHTPILSGFTRVTGANGSTRARIACGEHGTPDAVGGAAFLVGRCPSPQIELTLALTARGPVTGSIPTAVGGGPDAGGSSSALTLGSGDLDAGLR